MAIDTVAKIYVLGFKSATNVDVIRLARIKLSAMRQKFRPG